MRYWSNRDVGRTCLVRDLAGSMNIVIMQLAHYCFSWF